MLLYCRGDFYVSREAFYVTLPNFSSFTDEEKIPFDLKADIVEHIRQSITDAPSNCGSWEIAEYLDVEEDEPVVDKIVEYIANHIYDFKWTIRHWYLRDYIEGIGRDGFCSFAIDVPTELIDKLAKENK